MTSINRQSLKLAPFLEVFTPCLILLRNKLARAVILEVKISSLYVDLVDYGVREYIPRSNIFEIPAKYVLIFVFKLAKHLQFLTYVL